MSYLNEFLFWNSGNLHEKSIREAYAEWLVCKILNFDVGVYRNPGKLLEIEFKGISLDVISHSYLSNSSNLQLNKILFPIKPSLAKARIFCLLNEIDSINMNPDDIAMWDFWIVPSKDINRTRQSITLSPLIKSFGDPIQHFEIYHRLNRMIEENRF